METKWLFSIWNHHKRLSYGSTVIIHIWIILVRQNVTSVDVGFLKGELFVSIFHSFEPEIANAISIFKWRNIFRLMKKLMFEDLRIKHNPFHNNCSVILFGL